MTVRRRSRTRRLDRVAARSPVQAAGVALLRVSVPVAAALAIGYVIIAASPFLGQLLADTDQRPLLRRQP